MGRNIYVYIWISKLLFCTPETNSVVNQLYFSKKKNKQKTKKRSDLGY